MAPAFFSKDRWGTFVEQVVELPRVKDKRMQHLILMDLYDIVYGYHDHIGNSTPLSSALLHKGEQRLNLHRAHMREFYINKIHQHTGYTFDEWMHLELPIREELAQTIHDLNNDPAIQRAQQNLLDELSEYEEEVE